jgi:nucleoside triphosphate diphosphatase
MPEARLDPPTEALIRDPNGGIDRLLAIMDRLRDPATGCPWDVEQTFATIAPYTVEEAHEVADAIDRQAWGELKGELGDLLLQVVYHSQMASETGLFTFDDVTTAISDKMVARHPHVFGTSSRDKTAAQQTADWEALKAAERGPGRTLDGIALSLPALTRALKLQSRAARVGFDWPSTDEVLDKLTEEAAELVEARETLTQTEISEEMGDLLFQKFARRFARIEDWLAEAGKRPADSDLAEMDALWNRAKTEEKVVSLSKA